MALYGKVIRIFDESALLINMGRADGLKVGERIFVIETGDEITDPDTGESLGRLEMVKAELVAGDVQERVSVLKTAMLQRADSNLPLSTRMVRDSVRSDETRGKMSVASGEISGLPSSAPVRVGDTVRRVEE